MGGNEDNCMPTFSADTLDSWFLILSDRYFRRRENNTFFLVSTGTDLAINFDLVKCIKKKYIPEI